MAVERDTQARPGIDTFLGWVRESYEFFADCRLEMLRDCEMYDGAQWTPDQVQALKNVLGMQALTINRTFPTVNMLLGVQALGQTDIVAKGRTLQDTDVSHIASESLKFVMDQNLGIAKITDAFRGAVIPGFSAIEVLKNPDPRKEIIKLALREWKNTWWDPHGTPWFDTDVTRYVFTQRWVDIHDLIGLFPEFKDDIEGAYISMAGSGSLYSYGPDPTAWLPMVEKEENWQSAIWVDRPRKRVLPTEMWYTVRQYLTFALFADGRAFELEGRPPNEQAELVTACQEVVRGYVPKMRSTIFLGKLLLQDLPTPHEHDEFPFATFVGYLDRFNRPYGVPRQIRDMDIEINKRRTTALAKLNAKRVIVEDGAVDDMELTRQEAMRPDGLIILKRGKKVGEHIAITDNNDDLAGQIRLLQESEREIGEVIGAIPEQMGFESNAVSGLAIEKRQAGGRTVTAPIFDNLKRSKKKLGELMLSGIQTFWKGEKVIRVTDRFRGVERLVTINEKQADSAGQIVMRNDLSNTKFDIVVTDDIFSDVLREKYANILIESTKRCAPEAVPLVMDVAFELLDLPRKEFILMRLRQAFNLDVPPGEDLDKEEVAKQIQEQKAAKAEEQARQRNLLTEEQELKNEKLIAQVRKLVEQANSIGTQRKKVEVDTERIVAESDRADEKQRVDHKFQALDRGIQIAEIGVSAAQKDQEMRMRPKPAGNLRAVPKKKGGKKA